MKSPSSGPRKFYPVEVSPPLARDDSIARLTQSITTIALDSQLTDGPSPCFYRSHTGEVKLPNHVTFDTLILEFHPVSVYQLMGGYYSIRFFLKFKSYADAGSRLNVRRRLGTTFLTCSPYPPPWILNAACRCSTFKIQVCAVLEITSAVGMESYLLICSTYPRP